MRMFRNQISVMVGQFTLHVAQMHVWLVGVCACVQSNGWRTGHQILLKLYHIVLLGSK